MSILSRAYTDCDFEMCMSFLIKLFEQTQSFVNWCPVRFENSSGDDDDPFYLWFDEEKLVAMTAKEGKRDYFYFIDSEYTYVQDEIIRWIDGHAKAHLLGSQYSEYFIHAMEGEEKENWLKSHGFEDVGVYGWIRVHNNHFNHTYTLPDGYSIRTVTKHDHEAYAAAIRQTFGHGESFNKEVVDWLNSRSFHVEELDLLVVTDDDEIAAFCTFRVDPRSKIAELEPLGTLPSHRKKSLAQAVLFEGLNRLEKYKPVGLHIGGAADTPGANALYDKTGFTEKIADHRWMKKFDK
ncbi:MAG: GNAT family N-acetyltransferase [Candidatus Heimdallarchaeota archaeon]|nr:GNAT family N-acetyltransferase [Candidatus Heimdallarchaeota archaeon]